MSIWRFHRVCTDPSFSLSLSVPFLPSTAEPTPTYNLHSPPPPPLQPTHTHLHLLRHQRLHIPDHIRILLNAAITTEKAHAGHTLNTLADPLLLIFIRLIHQFLRLDIAAEIVADEVIVAVIDDAVAERAEAGGVPESA